jgi:hypothetical protein
LDGGPGDDGNWTGVISRRERAYRLFLVCMSVFYVKRLSSIMSSVNDPLVSEFAAGDQVAMRTNASVFKK